MGAYHSLAYGGNINRSDREAIDPEQLVEETDMEVEDEVFCIDDGTASAEDDDIDDDDNDIEASLPRASSSSSAVRNRARSSSAASLSGSLFSGGRPRSTSFTAQRRSSRRRESPPPDWEKVSTGHSDLYLDFDDDEYFAAEIIHVLGKLGKHGIVEGSSFTHHLHCWMKLSCIQSCFEEIVNPGLVSAGKNPLQPGESFKVWPVLLRAGYMKMSPSMAYRDRPSLESIIPLERLFEIFRSFDKTKRRSRRAGPSSTNTSINNPADIVQEEYRVPYSDNPDVKVLQQAYSRFAEFASKVAFLPDRTVITGDDDVMRVWSPSLTEACGIKMDYSDVKKSGIKINSFGSYMTGIILSEAFEVTIDNESSCDVIRKCVNTILTAVRRPVEYQIIGLDRYYTSIDIVNALEASGCLIIGTLQRNKLYPFLHQPTRLTPRYDWSMIDLKTPMAPNWAKRNVRGDVDELVLAFADGLGKVAHLHTTCPNMGPEYWTYVRYSRHSETETKGLCTDSSTPPPLPSPEAQTPAPPTNRNVAMGSRTMRRVRRAALVESSDEDESNEDSSESLSLEDMNLIQKAITLLRESTNKSIQWESFSEEYRKEVFEYVFRCVEERFVQLTVAQGGKEWFVLRVGRFTSTTTLTVLRSLAAILEGDFEWPYSEDAKSDCELVHRALSIQTALGSIGEINEANLNSKTKKMLVSILKMLGYTCSPQDKKAMLVQRILDLESPDLVRSCLAGWMMKPLADRLSLNVGKANEDNVMKRVYLFAKKHKMVQECVGTKEYGLVHRKTSRHQSCSVDGIICYVPCDDDDEHADLVDGLFCFANLEIKSRTTLKTVQEQEKLAKDCGGEFSDVFVDGSLSSSKKYRKLVPDLQHRAQILAHTATGVHETWYINASAVPTQKVGKILRVVRVRFSSRVVEALSGVLDAVSAKDFNWVFDNFEEYPSRERLEISMRNWSINFGQIRLMHRLLLCMENARAQLGKPLPPCRKLVPRLIASWNKLKYVVDKKSQAIASAWPRLSQWSPVFRLFVRLMFTTCYNAWKTWRLSRILDKVKGNEIRSLQHLRTLLDAQSSFRETLGLEFSVDDWLGLCNAFRDSGSMKESTTKRQIVMYNGKEYSLLDEKTKYDLKEALNSVQKALVRDGKIQLFMDLDVLKAHRKASYTYSGSAHKPAAHPSRLKCTLCCSLCEKKGSGFEHDKRATGLQTQTICLDCNVALCKTTRKMWGGKSCFDVWHDPRIDEKFKGNLAICPCENPVKSSSENDTGTLWGNPFLNSHSPFKTTSPIYAKLQTGSAVKRSFKRKRATSGLDPGEELSENSATPAVATSTSSAGAPANLQSAFEEQAS